MQTAIRSVCPKCGEVGTQIVRKTDSVNAMGRFLSFRHINNECFIGRVQTTREAFAEMFG